MADMDDLEQEIKNQVTKLRPLPGTKRAQSLVNEVKPPEIHALLEACQKASEIVLEVHANYQTEGEALATHLEKIGDTFQKMCREAAQKVRDLRVMPETMANDTSKELLSLGQQEEERHGNMTRGLTTAREALEAIQKLRQTPKPNGSR